MCVGIINWAQWYIKYFKEIINKHGDDDNYDDDDDDDDDSNVIFKQTLNDLQNFNFEQNTKEITNLWSYLQDSCFFKNV